MATAEFFDRITVESGTRDGMPHIPGLCIAVRRVLDLLAVDSDQTAPLAGN